MAIHYKDGSVRYVGACLAVNTSYAGDTHDHAHMRVWDNETGETKDIFLWHTGYGGNQDIARSEVDATEETIAAYNAYLAALKAEYRRNERKAKAAIRREYRASVIAVAHKHDFPVARFYRLRKQYTPNTLDSLIRLLSGNIRSGFKLSLRDQLVTWLRTTNPKYATPLSAKQINYV